MASLPVYYSSPVIHAGCTNDQVKAEVIVKIVAALKKKYPQASTIDGARVPFPDGWGLVRISSNLPVLVLIFEGKTPAALARIEAVFRQELAEFPEVSREWHNG